jgi:hypothetical protein
MSECATVESKAVQMDGMKESLMAAKSAVNLVGLKVLWTAESKV